jgi:glutaredoxin
MKGYYICISYGDPEIRNHYFQAPQYNWALLPQCPYKIFKPNIEEGEKNVVFSDKDKEKNKDYYHYVYIMEKGSESFTNIEDKLKTTQTVNFK